MDPAILTEILELKETPILRRATVAGYSCKLWGQYLALANGPPRGIVEGVMYDVQTGENAARLGEHEMRAYIVVPCDINLVDGEEPARLSGTAYRDICAKDKPDHSNIMQNDRICPVIS